MLNLVTVKARTRGKSPQMFEYQGIGNLTERQVLDKDQNPIILKADGSQAVYSVSKDGVVTSEDGVSKDAEGNLVPGEGNSFVLVHDVDASGLTEDPAEIVDLFGKIPARTVKDADGKDIPDPKDTPLQRMIDGAASWYNVLARKAASPVTEVVTEDELTPLIAEMVKAGVLTEDNVAVWRRTVTTGAKSIEMDRLAFAKITKEYKKLSKAA